MLQTEKEKRIPDKEIFNSCAASFKVQFDDNVVEKARDILNQLIEDGSLREFSEYKLVATAFAAAIGIVSVTRSGSEDFVVTSPKIEFTSAIRLSALWSNREFVIRGDVECLFDKYRREEDREVIIGLLRHFSEKRNRTFNGSTLEVLLKDSNL